MGTSISPIFSRLVSPLPAPASGELKWGRGPILHWP